MSENHSNNIFSQLASLSKIVRLSEISIADLDFPDEIINKLGSFQITNLNNLLQNQKKLSDFSNGDWQVSDYLKVQERVNQWLEHPIINLSVTNKELDVDQQNTTWLTGDHFHFFDQLSAIIPFSSIQIEKLRLPYQVYRKLFLKRILTLSELRNSCNGPSILNKMGGFITPGEIITIKQFVRQWITSNYPDYSFNDPYEEIESRICSYVFDKRQLLNSSFQVLNFISTLVDLKKIPISVLSLPSYMENYLKHEGIKSLADINGQADAIQEGKIPRIKRTSSRVIQGNLSVWIENYFGTSVLTQLRSNKHDQDKDYGHSELPTELRVKVESQSSSSNIDNSPKTGISQSGEKERQKYFEDLATHLNILDMYNINTLNTIRINDLGLPTRLNNGLMRAGFRTLGDLVTNKGVIIPGKIRYWGVQSTKEFINFFDLWIKNNSSILGAQVNNGSPIQKTVIDNQNEQQFSELIAYAEKNDLNQVNITDMNLTPRQLHFLRREKINTIGELAEQLPRLFNQNIRGFGTGSKLDLEGSVIEWFKSRKQTDEVYAIHKQRLSRIPTDERISFLQILGTTPEENLILNRLGLTSCSSFYKNIRTLTGDVQIPEDQKAAILEKYEWVIQNREIILAKNDLKNLPVYMLISTAEIVDLLFRTLNENQKNILFVLYGLYDGQIKTLQETAEIFNVSRERIRQIQSNGLNKLLWNKKDYYLLYRWLKSFIPEKKIVVHDKDLALLISSSQTIDNVFIDQLIEFAKESILLKSQQILRYHKSINSWSSTDTPPDSIEQIVAEVNHLLNEKGSVMQWADLYNVLIQKPGLYTLSEELAFDILQCCKREGIIDQNGDGSWGPHRKKLKRNDRLVAVLKEIGEPAHFSKIAEVHNQLFDENQITTNNAHASMQADDSLFTRTGRGMYGLVEWGLPKDGNIANGIYRILREKKHPLSFDEIVREIQKTWQVNVSSITAAISLDPRFSRTDDDRYWLSNNPNNRNDQPRTGRRTRTPDKTRVQRLMEVLDTFKTPVHHSEILTRHNELFPELPLTKTGINVTFSNHKETFIRVASGVFALRSWGITMKEYVSNALYNCLEEDGFHLLIIKPGTRSKINDSCAVAYEDLLEAINGDDRFELEDDVIRLRDYDIDQ